jgi:endonuclease/exonuclease/phosphatase (EEP) superfamily protein YafD
VTESPTRRRTLLGRVLWIVFVVLEAPLLIAVAAGLAAGVLHPATFWWAQLCAAFLPYLALALAAAAAGSLIAKRWGWFALHALLLSLAVLRTFAPASHDPRPASADDLVLMTFNAPQYGPSAETLRDSMVSLIRARRPDILAMQEAWIRGPLDPEPEHLAAHLEAVDAVLPYRVMAGLRDGESYVPVLFREGTAEPVDARILGLPTRREAGESDELRVRFRWQGREAVLYNIHLRSYGAAKPWRDPRLDVLRPATWLPYLRQYRDAYRGRAAEVERLAEAIDRETLPVIVAGDFNEGPFSWAYRRLSRVAAGGMRQDAFHVAGRGDGRTYSGRRPVVRIDFVLADPAFEVVDAVVPATTISDHRPVVVRLRWREEGD